MTMQCPIGPPPVDESMWIGKFWSWVTKVWFPAYKSTSAGGNGIDHGALSGLADDDHTQYLDLAPLTSARNIVGDLQTDVVLVTLARNSITPHTSDVLQVTDSTLAVIAKITNVGKIFGTGLDAKGNEVTTVANPTASDSAATMGWVQIWVPAGSTTGDLLVWDSGAGTYGVLAIGTNGRVLTADDTQPLGVKWS